MRYSVRSGLHTACGGRKSSPHEVCRPNQVLRGSQEKIELWSSLGAIRMNQEAYKVRVQSIKARTCEPPATEPCTEPVSASGTAGKTEARPCLRPVIGRLACTGTGVRGLGQGSSGWVRQAAMRALDGSDSRKLWCQTWHAAAVAVG
jgi:hypothetical protein